MRYNRADHEEPHLEVPRSVFYSGRARRTRCKSFMKTEETQRRIDRQKQRQKRGKP